MQLKEPPPENQGAPAGRTKAELERGDAKPAALPVRPAGMPAELRDRPQWVCWGYQRRVGKDGVPRWTKVPFAVRGGPASSTDPSTWGDFGEALAYHRGCPDATGGLGFVFAPDDPYCGVDLDDAYDPDGRVIRAWARPLVELVSSYTEVSPSGTGLKVFVRGRLTGDRHRKPYGGGEVEVYDRGRYFAVTGHRLDGYPDVEDRQEQLDRLYTIVFGEAGGRRDAPHRPPRPAPDLADEALVAKALQARNGGRFRALWEGSTAGYASDSEADAALLGMLAFWTNGDGDRMDRLFRQSGLCRDKWTEREDYRERTINFVLEGRTDFYTPGGNGWASGNGHGGPAPDAGDAHLTDLGNARRVVARHGHDLRYNHPWKSWLVWEGRRWADDDTAEAVRRVKETQSALYRDTAEQIKALGEVGDDGERKRQLARLTQLMAHALKWEERRRIDDSLKLAQSEPGVPVLAEQLDRDPFLFNVRNGTLDLRTGTLRPHRREDLITKLAPVEYRPDAPCPLWERFLARVMDGNKDLVGYLQRVVGYCLSGDVSEQCLWFFHGGGANGKSTFLGAVLSVFGDYGLQAVSDLLMVKKNESHPTERADLFGRRMAATIETEEGKRIAEALMKQLTGGDRVRARNLYKDFFEFLPTHKIILAANHKPQVRGTDLAAWRRIKLVPWAVTIPDAEKDKALPEKLKAELPGILAWAVRGCLAWQREGLAEPDEVRAATAEYRREQDTVTAFLSACCRLDPDDPSVKVQAKLLYERYLEWSGDKDTSMRGFGDILRKNGYTGGIGTGNRYYWHGIGVTASMAGVS